MHPKLSFRSLLAVHGLSTYLCDRFTTVLINYVYYTIYTEMEIVKRSIKDALFFKNKKIILQLNKYIKKITRLT